MNHYDFKSLLPYVVGHSKSKKLQKQSKARTYESERNSQKLAGEEDVL